MKTADISTHHRVAYMMSSEGLDKKSFARNGALSTQQHNKNQKNRLACMFGEDSKDYPYVQK
tara:strand:+ start:700 stop:885 length:186 start_codon:yes stop_codon:yes gene_type:complete